MRLFTEGKIPGSTHLAIGQEAVAVGAASALRPNDKVLCTYRGHHHCLARGMSPFAAMAEMLGREAGCCRGRGGSMHLTDVSLGLMGSHAIVGAHLPIAVGCAWSAKIQGTDAVTIAFFGDGTTTIGAFHEAVGLASAWDLPIIFVCENNLYSEYTPIGDVVKIEDPASGRAGAYGIPGTNVDGNDVYLVKQAVEEASARCRGGRGPTIIEAKTYRHGGHSRADPGTYRPSHEVAEWMARDPLRKLETTLAEAGVGEEVVAESRRSAEAEIDAATLEALSSPEPRVEDLVRDVYAGREASPR
jgi:pyruvate dehydrogenase E1 component alpha subunit